ncbi:MAG TPA: flavin reductase family protein, partial [Ktedonobacterales bacterium]|nr:flavin reductase family protein [Ktedonobacterales bacterium]
MITPKQREDDETMEVSHADFRKVLGRFATGVSVVTTCDGEHRLGITVNAFSSVSLDPPLILVCIEKTSYLHQVMLRNGYFAVNVLGEDQLDLCKCFAGHSTARRNFCDTPSHTAVTGAPV